MSKSAVKDPHEKDVSGNQMVQTQEMHCSSCGRFLGFQAIVWGVIKVKCPNCKEWNTIEIIPDGLRNGLDNLSA